MKTTLNINDNLLADAKMLAARQGSTLTRLVEEGLKLRLHGQRTPAQRGRLPVYKGKGGLISGLNGTSNKALREAAFDDA